MPPLQIPFTIGVTGHRQIAASCTAKIEAAVLSILEGVRAKAPDAPLLLLTGLAEGADRLVARLAVERFGAELVAVLPRAADDYRQDFATAARAAGRQNARADPSTRVCSACATQTDAVAE